MCAKGCLTDLVVKPIIGKRKKDNKIKELYEAASADAYRFIMLEEWQTDQFEKSTHITTDAEASSCRMYFISH